MKKRIGAILAVAVLLLTLSVPALATESQELDPVTGLPLGSYETIDGELGGYVDVEDAFRYDSEAKCFLYTLGSDQYSTNVPNGAFLPTDHSVSIQLSGGLSATLYRDGAVVAEPDLNNITGAGFYVLQLSGTRLYDSAQFSFVIAPSFINSINELQLPKGFAFKYVKKDGEDQYRDYANYFEFREDGLYQLCWGNESIEREYTVKFILDREAPTLALPGVVDGVAKGPVDLSDLESNCHIVLETGDKTTTLKGNNNTLKDTGTYTLTVYDPAGNSTQYRFTIELYLNVSAVFVIILWAALMAGILVYCYRTRKNARVG